MVLAIFASLTANVGLGQGTVALGTPAFGSFAGGPDVVNIGNLNVHWNFPIMNKAGRGVPFSFNILYDSTIWAPTNVNGNTVWAQQNSYTSFGWPVFGGNSPPVGGSIQYTTVTHATGGACAPNPANPRQPPVIYSATLYLFSNYTYVDPQGTSHVFSTGYVAFTGSASPSCPYGGGPSNPNSTTNYTSVDGYTLTLVENSSGVFATVTSKSGQNVTPSAGTCGVTPGAAEALDGNGNQVTSLCGVFTDTLGQTVLTATGGSATPPVVFTGTTVSGGPSTWQLEYAPYTVQTNFQCSGVSEYGPSTQELPSGLLLPDGRSYSFTYETTPGYSGSVTGRIASVTLPTGGKISYAYSGGNNGINCTDSSPVTLTRTTPDGTTTYTRNTSGLTAGTTASGDAGYSTTTITDPLNNQTLVTSIVSYYGAGQPNNYSENARQIYSGTIAGGNLLETILTCYSNGAYNNASNCTATFPGNNGGYELPGPGSFEVVRTTQWPNNTGISSGTLDVLDSVQNVTSHVVYDYSAGSSLPSVVLQTTNTTYPNVRAQGGVVSYESSSPAEVTVLDSGGNTISDTKYAYNETSLVATSGTPQHQLIFANPMNLTTVQKWVSGSNWLTSHTSYYDTGNVATTTDVNNAVTTYSYGSGSCGNSFPTSVNSAIPALVTSATWSCAGGVKLTSVDVNGNTTTYNYGSDPYWRPVTVTNNATGAVTTYTYPTSSSNSSSVAMNINGGASTSTSVTTYDGQGRTILQQKQQGPNSSNYDSVATAYDSLGRVTKQTLPYTSALGSSVPTNPGTTTAYDALNRTTLVTDGGGGTTQYTYSENDVLIASGPAPSGENVKQRSLQYDGAGELTSVCEITTSLPGAGSCGQNTSHTGYLTKYIYDGGNLTTVQQNAQPGSTGMQTRSLSYDGVGRKLSETIPEWSAGTGVAGTSSYTYDSDSSGTCSGSSAGDLIKSVDNAGNVTCLTYDILHRPLSSKVVSGTYSSVTPQTYMVYDAATLNGTAMQNVMGSVAEAYTCAPGSGSCSGKLTDIFNSATPVTSGPAAGGVTSSMWESTPHSGGYFLTQETKFPNGAISAISASLSGSSAGSTTNLITDSNQVGGNNWWQYCAGNSNGMVLDTPTVSAPDGSNSATQFTMPSSYNCGAAGPWGALTNVQGGLTAGATYTVSAWLRGAVGGESLDLALNDCTGASFTLTTSWQRYTATFSSISSGVANCSTGARGFQVIDWTANSTFYIWGPQTVQAATPGPYVATTNGAATETGYIGIPSLSFGVDGEGRPNSATDSTNNLNLVTATTYNPASAATSITYGNAGTGSGSDTDSFIYDPATNRPTTLTYTVSPSSGAYVVSSGLTWNANGSLKQFQYADGSPAPLGQTCTYTADDLSRIASVNCGNSTWAQNFSYDAFGNINKSVPSGATGTAYSAAYSTVTNQVSGGPSYDANGNQLTSTPATLTWNALNQPISVNSTSATYDALGRMVEKGSGGTYTQFVFRPSGAMLAVYSGGLVKGTIPLPGGSTAIYNASGVNYIRHTDWLGSSRLATTWAHTVYSKEAYAPFGETYNEAGTPDRSFTGQDQDVATGAAGSGVYDFLFRKYDPSAGRWLSPDPAGWKAANQAYPQSLDRYTYVQNNPLSAVDAAGLECVWDDGSYDAKDDVSTGNPGGCQGQGGTWIELGEGGNWDPNRVPVLQQAVSNIQNGIWTSIMVTNPNGSENYTFYTSGARAIVTDTGGVLNGYAYFDTNDTNAILAKTGSDPGGVFGNWLYQRSGVPVPLDPNDPDFRLQLVSDQVYSMVYQHPFGNDLNESSCNLAGFLLYAGGSAAVPWAGDAIGYASWAVLGQLGGGAMTLTHVCQQ